jgi:hypothetical protein
MSESSDSSTPDTDPFSVAQSRILRDDNEQLRQAAAVDHLLIEELKAQALIDAREVETLQTALIAARRIGAAIGYIMALEQVDEVEAFGRLSMASQNTNRRLRDVANDVLAGAPGNQRPATVPAAGSAPEAGAEAPSLG